MKNVCILGSTGSIGRNSLEVISGLGGRFRASYLSAHKNVALLQEQIKRFQPDGVALIDPAAAELMRKTTNGSMRLYSGEEGLTQLVRSEGIDIVISSLVGFAGLRPTLEAVRRGKVVALANKEALVVAGGAMTSLAARHGARIVPVDSEHSAILQCLAGEDPASISRLILTASGGPFLNVDKKSFSSISVEAALSHPTWSMGDKISIDSATMMNKGLEVIEAHWLFNLPPEKIEVVIHPQSIIHSMVEFVDGSIKAQLGVPDMKIPIQYALTCPDRMPSAYNRVDFASLRELTFFKPDMEKFECLGLAYDALRRGGTAPAILNAANEEAVALFLGRAITFDRIPAVIREAMDGVPAVDSPEVDDIIAADAAARAFVAHSRARKGMHAVR